MVNYLYFVVFFSPFYGYHQQDHQFLKIYLYNPTFVKRCANLLQNGAILGRIYQPYESHVPFILQFLIDFNLYGMSFLYVPTSVIKYRQNIADGTEIDETLTNIDKSQVLDKKFERMTTSKREIDITAAFILNRFQISFQANAEHANPGIAFIWNDERGRRQQMNDEVSYKKEIKMPKKINKKKLFSTLIGTATCCSTRTISVAISMCAN